VPCTLQSARVVRQNMRCSARRSKRLSRPWQRRAAWASTQNRTAQVIVASAEHCPVACRGLEAEEQALAEARTAGKHPVWNHGDFSVEYPPPPNVLKIGGVHVDYLLDNQNDAQAVASISKPEAFFERLYLHFVFSLAGVRPATGQARSAAALRRQLVDALPGPCSHCFLNVPVWHGFLAYGLND
jgi:hypothetical protein